ncbi:MAG: AraC family transcriptional regulator [Streptosporangiaceae bacterium]|nr:AraC family transcriptional regulator [Streptosporangiaceae bacterium]MBV9853088.1 AraC family transcriptional regulator [Streptosporangiaceae bacterium]
MNDWETRIRRYASEAVNGQVVHWPAAPWLSDYVLGYSGFDVTLAQPIPRRLLPFGGVSVLVDLVPPVRRALGTGIPAAFRFPVAGMHDCPIVFSQSGHHFGVGIGLTPAGAYALFGTPMHELRNVVAELGDLIGPRADQLAERLAQARGWPARFGLLDELLPTWIKAGPAQREDVAHAWRRLRQSAGCITVAELADDVGRSGRYLEMRFRDQIGLSPKTAARVLRFQRALRIATASGCPAWSEVAARCGYVDQAHLNRDFRRFAGCSPTELLAV